MAVVPFYKLLIEDSRKDITNLVTSFNYDRSLEKDNILTLTLQLDEVEDVDDKDLVEGKKLIFKYGLVGGKVSKKRKVKIKSSIPTFGSKLSMKIICHDLGTDLKRNTSQEIYKDKTTSQIATIIADSKGLGKNILPTTKVWEDMPQGNKSDFELLRYLAAREDNGDFIVFVDNDILHLVKRDLSKKSQATYEYNDGDGAVIKFRPSYKEAESAPEASATSMSPFDLIFNNSNTEEPGDNLGEELVHYDQDAIEIGRSGGPAKKGKEIVTPVEDKQEARNLSKSVRKAATLKTLVATLEIELDPLLEINKVLTMKGVGQKYSGNWYVMGLKDNIKDRGITTVSLSKNSTRKALRSITDKNAKGDINKDVGPNETGATVTLVHFDEDANEIGRS